MRIIAGCVVLSCLVSLCTPIDEHRPLRKGEERGKRNLDQYQTSHHYHQQPQPHLTERRISNQGQTHHLPPIQYYPRPYRKDVHSDDPLTTVENNRVIGDDVERKATTYVHVKPKIVERPVYIKEPEPIIEIIIKESNVSLPAPPPPPPPPKKKKEQVQVFFVKYKKNPHGVGKDAIIYDKPVPAISPKLPEDDEEEEQYQHQQEPYEYHDTATLPPPPSTTLRTIIKPDSETYHSQSGIKVTFGKEGFDYDKRASKPEEYAQLEQDHLQHHQPLSPQGRQLSSFSHAYFKPPLTNFQSPPAGYKSDHQRQRQISRPAGGLPPSPPPGFKPYRQPPPPPPPQQQQSQPHLYQPQFSKPQQHFNQPQQFAHTISHPPPTRFHSQRVQNQNPQQQQQQQPPQRQPVPYKPFDNYRPSEPSHVQFRPETYFPAQQQLPLQQQSHPFGQRLNARPQQSFQPPAFRPPQQQQHQVSFQEAPPQQIQFPQQQRPIPHPLPLQQPPQDFRQHDHRFNVVPPGGELIHSVPRFEQHISSVEPASAHQQQPQQQPQHQPPSPQHQSLSPQHQSLSPQQLQQKVIDQFNSQEQESFVRQQNYIDHQRKYLESQQRQRQQDELRQYYQQQQQQQNHHHQDQEIVITSPTPSTVYQATRKAEYVTPQPSGVSYQVSSTTARPTSTVTTEASTPSTTTKDPKVLEAQLPDEVPEELRQQLLSSGILNNADISVLDYDKVGDIPLSALPPDQLANFYNAGGATQLAGSDPVPSIVDKDGTPVSSNRLVSDRGDLDEPEPEASEIREVRVEVPQGKTSPGAVDLKVVRYDPDTDKGQRIQETYVQVDQSKQVNPVALNDDSYTRYLPLKVNGSQFPIPDVPELKGKKISSVVVLAPVTYDFSKERRTRELKRQNDLDLIEGDSLKKLLSQPTLENYRSFLDNENRTKSDKQSVILLVADQASNKEREIFMYDVATQTVSKLSGELSSAFVEAAEANSKDEPAAAASDVVEARVPYEDSIKVSPSEEDEDMETDASEQIPNSVDVNDSKT